jgi:hypothetical protein
MQHYSGSRQINIMWLQHNEGFETKVYLGCWIQGSGFRVHLELSGCWQWPLLDVSLPIIH